MSSYFVAKGKNGELIGEFTLDAIVKAFEDGKLPGYYAATKADGLNYHRIVEQEDAVWFVVCRPRPAVQA